MLTREARAVMHVTPVNPDYIKITRLLAHADEADKVIERLRGRVERLDVQLAGCGVAAYGGTGDRVIAKRDEYGWSDSYQATLDLRIKYDSATKAIEQLREAVLVACRENTARCRRATVFDSENLECTGNCIYGAALAAGEHRKGEGMSTQFEKDIREVINRHSMESASNTPDCILAEFLANCLVAFGTATQQRERWYGRDARPGVITPVAAGGGSGKDNVEPL